MVRTGVLVHARNPKTLNWEELVWGVPAEDRLGDLTKLIELILREADTEPVTCIVIGTSAATKVGLLEGEYTKKFLLDRLDALTAFPRLKNRLQQLSEDDYALLRSRLENIVVTPIVKNTSEELIAAARIFREQDIHEVVQITAASHGPRCVQVQAVAREQGHIPKDQLWYVMITDMCFKDAAPLTTLVLEPPHRGDDPMVDFKPTLPEVLRPYIYDLSPADKKKFIHAVKDFMDEHAQHNVQ